MDVCSHDSLTPYWLNGFDFWAKYAVRSRGGSRDEDVLSARLYSSAYVVPELHSQLDQSTIHVAATRPRAS